MMTTDQRAELDAAVARFPVSLPWFACPTERDGVTGIHGEPHGEPPYQGVAYLADVFGDAAPIVAAMNAVPLLTATIDAQAAEIARLREAAKRSLQGWENVVELGLIPMQHHDTATALADVLRAALAPNGAA